MMPMKPIANNTNHREKPEVQFKINRDADNQLQKIQDEAEKFQRQINQRLASYACSAVIFVGYHDETETIRKIIQLLTFEQKAKLKVFLEEQHDNVLTKEQKRNR